MNNSNEKDASSSNEIQLNDIDDKPSEMTIWLDVKQDMPLRSFQDEVLFFPNLPLYTADYVFWGKDKPQFVYLLEELGHGTFGNVYQAIVQDSKTARYSDTKTQPSNTIYAAKVMNIKLRNENWISELKIHQGLNHPNIVQFVGVMEFDCEGVLLIEYCSKGSLRSLFQKMIENSKRFPESFIRRIAVDVLSGLQYLHFCKLVHCDIKLGNIVLDQYGTAKIIDFGLSQFWSEGKPLLTKVTGTARYVAPEIINKSYDNKVDIWALGVVLFCLVEKRHLFPAKEKKKIFKMVRAKPVPMYFRRRVSKSLEDVVLFGMLMKDPLKRMHIEDCIDLLRMQDKSVTPIETSSPNTA